MNELIERQEGVGQTRRVPVFLVRPRAAAVRPAIVLFMEAFGLNAHIMEVARRLAREGYVVCAPNLYHREAHQVFRYDDLPGALAAMGRLTDDQAMDDVGLVLEALAGDPGVQPGPVGMTGFCMGGRLTFLAACRFPDRIGAAAPFYGGGIAADGPCPLDEVGGLRVPLLLFFGERDTFIPRSQVARITSTLQAQGAIFESKVFAGAGHGFFCDARASYHPEAAADAWRRLTAWFAGHLGQGTGRREQATGAGQCGS